MQHDLGIAGNGGHRRRHDDEEVRGVDGPVRQGVQLPRREGAPVQHLPRQLQLHPELQVAGGLRLRRRRQPFRRPHQRRVHVQVHRCQAAPRGAGAQARGAHLDAMLHRLEVQGRRHRRQGPRRLRVLLGVRGGGGDRGADPDQDGAADAAVGTGAGGLRHQQQRLRRRAHGPCLRAGDRQARHHRGERVPVHGVPGQVPRGRPAVQPRGADHEVRRRAAQRRAAAGDGRGAAAGDGVHRRERAGVPVLQLRGVPGAVRHGADPRRDVGRVLPGRRVREEVLGGEELVGQGLGAGGLRAAREGRRAAAGHLRPRRLALLPHGRLISIFIFSFKLCACGASCCAAFVWQYTSTSNKGVARKKVVRLMPIRIVSSKFS